MCAGFDEHEFTGLLDIRDGTRGRKGQSHGCQPGIHGEQLWLGFQSYHQRVNPG